MQGKLLQEFHFWDSVLLSHQTFAILWSCTADFSVWKASDCQECSLRGCDLLQLILAVQARCTVYTHETSATVANTTFFSQFNFISLLSLILRSAGLCPAATLVLLYCHLILKWQFLLRGNQIDATLFLSSVFSTVQQHHLICLISVVMLVKSHLPCMLMLFFLIKDFKLFGCFTSFR